MKSAAELKLEKARFDEIHSFKVLDSSPEEEYDAITSLAAEICEAPISLITFIVEKRQWFKSNLGVEIRETPRDISFCSHAIEEPSGLVVFEDLTKDPRFSNNPFVTGPPHARFYAGAPMVTSNGLRIGTLCVIDTKSRTLSDFQGKALRTLSSHVVALLELRRSKSALEESLGVIRSKYAELRDFNFISSHDLQEPLRTIKAYSNFLSENYVSEIDEVGQRSLQFISSSAERMGKLIAGVMEYSQIDSLQKESLVDCNAVLDQVMLDYSKLIGDTQASIQVESLPTVRGSEFGLRTVFQNLMCNALKFCPEDRKPEVLVRSEQKGKTTIFEVRDNGIGIDPIHQNKIFNLFFKLHTSEEFKGNGIGLALCRKIVELHNGEIWFESEPNKGSSFFFSIEEKS